MTEYIILSDIHDNLEHLLKVLSRYKSKPVICLGDIFEVLVSKSKLETFRFETLDQVLYYDPKMTEILDSVRMIKGNQEERLEQLVPSEKLPRKLYELLNNMQETVLLEERFLFIHGQQFVWEEIEYDLWCPNVDIPNPFCLFYGHSHHDAFFELVDRQPIKIDFTYSKPIFLDPNKKYLINVGAIKNDPLSYVILDTKNNFITFYH
ncbi:metallophosphoesterase family protein [Enterococcus plantarum]|uniref:metallophosphoesterase family protein n=1 Tax=Enterococcus plantarum TaxID=1077675 RepID=UPI001A8E3F42|nr:metallophosphoesterase family protein [Enterococcus plantarum]MBO0422169.1 metallophosphoesterase family protein [Enterococcus plantarum]